MKKSTLLKKTKNELADMLILLDINYERLKDKYDVLDINYRETCDDIVSYRTENAEYIKELAHNERRVTVLFIVCVILLIAYIILLFI